jgi:hypothetical protein
MGIVEPFLTTLGCVAGASQPTLRGGGVRHLEFDLATVPPLV